MNKKLKILIDDECFSYQSSYGGISKLLINQFRKIHNENIIFIFPFPLSNNKYLNKIRFPTFFFSNFFFKIARIINLISIYFFIKFRSYDLLHLSYLDQRILRMNKKPLVINIWDLTPELHPEFFENTTKIYELKQNAINKANIITVPSNFVKDKLTKFYNIDPNKIEIIYPELEIHKSEKVYLPAKYFLYVGNRNGYKNFKILAKAFSLIENKEIKIVCIGGEKISAQEISYYKNLKIYDRMFFLSLNDNQLRYCYENTISLIYTSFSEGFGLPILEAYNYKTSCILPEIELYKEITNESPIFFKKNNHESLYAVMNKRIEQNKRKIHDKFEINNKILDDENNLKNIYLKLINN